MNDVNSNTSIIEKEDAKYLQGNSCDACDYLTAVACGAIGGLVDIFFVSTPEDSKLGKWTDQQVDNTVMAFARKMGWNPKEKTSTMSIVQLAFWNKDSKLIMISVFLQMSIICSKFCLNHIT